MPHTDEFPAPPTNGGDSTSGDSSSGTAAVATEEELRQEINRLQALLDELSSPPPVPPVPPRPEQQGADGEPTLAPYSERVRPYALKLVIGFRTHRIAAIRHVLQGLRARVGEDSACEAPAAADSGSQGSTSASCANADAATAAGPAADVEKPAGAAARAARSKSPYDRL